MRYAKKRAKNLRTWNAVARDAPIVDNMPDVVTGATRTSHGRYTAHWDFSDVEGRTVPHGTYTVRMELTDHDTSTGAGNNLASFTFEKNGDEAEQIGLSSGGFEDVSMRYEAGIDYIEGEGGVECKFVAACVDNDGCCLPDCVFEVDNDCDPATERDLSAGCSSSGSSGGGLTLLLVFLFVMRGRAWLRVT